MTTEKNRSSWEAFLPRRAIVMAQRPIPILKNDPIDTEANSEKGPVLFAEQQIVPTSTSASPTLETIAASLQGCQRCKLCSTRKSIVVGEGSPHAQIVFIGEGPGEQEDLDGRPFVGKAGQLLDRMIGAIQLDRKAVYIANVVKCRPPGNRNPEPDEIQACSPFLFSQLNVIQPKIVVALGKFAAQTLLQTDQRISVLRGRFHNYRNMKLMPTFHPSYLLRNPAAKRETWIDLQMVAQELGISLPSRRDH